MLNIVSTISLIGIIQGLFMLMLIFFKKDKALVSYFAIGLLAVFLVDLTWYFIYQIGRLDQFWYIIGLENVVLYLYGPILYLYVKAHFINGNIKISRIAILLHLLPALLMFVFTSPLFFAEYTGNFLNYLKTVIPNHYHIHNVLFGFTLWYIHVIFYLILTIKFIKKINASQELNYDKQLKVSHIKWIQLLFLGYLLFPLVVGLDFIVFLFTGYDFNSFDIANSLLVFHIFVISYIGFTNQDLLLNPIKKLKQQTTNLSKLDLQKLGEDLQVLMEQQKLYLQPNLSLSQLAQKLSISSHQLSEFLNQKNQKSFNDFINSYRIRDAKTLLQAPDNQAFTIEAIAYEVGFKSPSTFYRYFNKFVGVTPSAWMKKEEMVKT